MMRIPGVVIGALVIGIPAVIRTLRERAEQRNTAAAARLAQQRDARNAHLDEKQP